MILRQLRTLIPVYFLFFRSFRWPDFAGVADLLILTLARLRRIFGGRILLVTA